MTDTPGAPGLSPARLHALLRASRAVSASLDAEATRRAIARAAVELTGSSAASVWIADEAGRELTLRAFSDERLARDFPAAPVSFGEGVVGWTAEHRALLAVASVVAGEPALAPDWARTHGLPSVVAVPLLLQDAVLGVLVLHRPAPWTLDPDDRVLLHGFAGQAAVALGNSRRHGLALRRQREAEALASVGRLLAQSLDLGHVAQRIADSVRAILQARTAAVYRLDPASGDLRALAISAEAPVRFDRPFVHPHGTGLVSLAVRDRQAVQTQDLLADPRVVASPELRGWVARLGFGAVLALPLVARDAVVGALTVADRAGRVFDAEDVRLAEAFTVQAATALECACLYAESEAARQRFLDLVEGLDAVVWEADWPARGGEADAPDRPFTLVSRRAETLLGHPLARWLREPGFWASLVHPDDRDRVFTAARTALALGEDCQLEYRALTAAGAVVWLRDTVQVVRDPHGRPRQLRGLTVDATERRRAEQRRALQVAVTSVLAEAATLEEAIRRLLQVVCESLGWDLGEMWLVDRPSDRLRWGGVWHAPLVAAAEFAAVSREMAFAPGRGLPGRVWAGGQPEWVPNVVEDPDFLRAAFAAQEGLRAALGFPIRTNGNVTGVMVFFSHEVRPPDPDVLKMVADIGAQIGQFAERKRAEEALRQSEGQLRQAQKMEAVGRLAGGIAHDFNNLLTVMLGYAEALLQDLREADARRDDAEQIRDAAQRAAALTRQLLAFSRKQVLAPRVLDLHAVVAAMAPMLRRLIGEDIELVIVQDPEPGLVRADPAQLEQVVLNLAANARDAMPRGGRLVFETARVEIDEATARSHPGLGPGPHVRLAVRDTGVGMDPETLAHAFEPFFTTKGLAQGTGLGLAMVYGIVRQHEGHVAADSAPGQGTTFTLLLPRVEGPVESVSVSPGAAERPRGVETVLLVEDDTAVRDLAREVLAGAGYRVLAAATGGVALWIAEQHVGPLHLLVTDVVMPQMSGVEVARRLLALRPGARVLFMSGYPDDALLARGLAGTGAAFLPKPFTPAVLLGTVREVLDAPAPAPGTD